MNWLQKQTHALSERLIQSNSRTFWLKFSVGTFVIPASLATTVIFNLDNIEKVIPLPTEPGMYIFSIFLIAWIFVMIAVATIVFTYGGHLIRYSIPDDRLDTLKTSGLITKTHKKISLIGLSLHPFSNESWRRILEDKIKTGVLVRLLIFDPDTEFAKNRQSSLQYDRKLCDDINEAVNRFSALKAKISKNNAEYSENFDLRLYKGNASMSAFIFDDEIRLGLYIENLTGLTAPEIRIANQGGQTDIFSLVEEHFDNVWNTSSEIKQPENNNGQQ